MLQDLLLVVLVFVNFIGAYFCFFFGICANHDRKNGNTFQGTLLSFCYTISVVIMAVNLFAGRPGLYVDLVWALYILIKLGRFAYRKFI